MEEIFKDGKKIVNFEEEVKKFTNGISRFKMLMLPKDKNEYMINRNLAKATIEPVRFSQIDESNFEEEFERLFISNIHFFGKNIARYYRSLMSNVTIVRDKDFENGAAQIELYKGKITLTLTQNHLTLEDFIAYSHELGHLPSFVNPVEHEYYDYSETLPIFMEYLACGMIDTENKMDLFLRNRLDSTRSDAIDFLYYYGKLRDDYSYREKFLIIQLRETMMYNRSFDFALQLINRLKNNSDEIRYQLIQNIFSEKSFKEIAEDLGIKTDGCKNLLKVKKRMSR